MNSKDAKLRSIFPEPPSALIACIRDSRSATTLQQKGFTVRGFYGIAAKLYSLSAAVFGAVPISAAIVSDLTAGVGRSLPSQRDATGDDKVSCEVSIASFTALARRSLNIEILRDPAKGKCISSIPRRAEFIFKRRGHFEQFSDADAKKLLWLEIFGYPLALACISRIFLRNLGGFSEKEIFRNKCEI